MLSPDLDVPKQIRIAVLDTGFNYTVGSTVKLCETGHKDFTTTGFKDKIGHGTHIINTIVNNLDKNVDYCIILLKWYDPETPKYFVGTTNKLQFEHLLTQKVDVINFSGGGMGNSPAEKDVIIELLQRKVKINVAAGNDGVDMDKNCKYYPTCYKIPGINIVGNIANDGERAYNSNYGSMVTEWEMGVGVLAETGYGVKALSGTSMACAVATAKTANRLSRRKK